MKPKKQTKPTKHIPLAILIAVAIVLLVASLAVGELATDYFTASVIVCDHPADTNRDCYVDEYEMFAVMNQALIEEGSFMGKPVNMPEALCATAASTFHNADGYDPEWRTVYPACENAWQAGLAAPK